MSQGPRTESSVPHSASPGPLLSATLRLCFLPPHTGCQGPGTSLCIYSVAFTHSLPVASYFFCRIITYDPTRGASGPISKLENQLPSCPEQCYQGCSAFHPNSDAFSPPCLVLPSLIKPIFCRQPKLLLAVVSSPHRETPFTTVSREAKSLTPNQNKVTR